MNPFSDHTIIHIDIQAPNQLEVLTCIRETFDYMPGWIFCSSVFQSPTDARFYCFNLTMHTFEWWRTNDSYADTMDEDDVVIKDLADISYLLEFVWLNGDALRKQHIKPVVVDPPKKRKEEEKLSADVKIKQLIKGMVNHDIYEELGHVQPMDMPKGKVFYTDILGSYYGGKSKTYSDSQHITPKKQYPYWGAPTPPPTEEWVTEAKAKFWEQVKSMPLNPYNNSPYLKSPYDKHAYYNAPYGKNTYHKDHCDH